MAAHHTVSFDGRSPRVHPTAFVAPTAVLIGEVTVEAGASVWYGAVLRADLAPIVVGPQSNVQDNAVIHTDEDLPTLLAERVTVGHAAVLEGCRIGPGTLIGMRAVVLNRATVGRGSLVAAASVVLEDAEIPDGVLAAGAPAVIRRPLTRENAAALERAAEEYVRLAAAYAEQGLAASAGLSDGG